MRENVENKQLLPIHLDEVTRTNRSNSSFNTGYGTNSLKLAVIKPLIKKTNKNNLTSTLVIVAQQLGLYSHRNNLHKIYQSGYMPQ